MFYYVNLSSNNVSLTIISHSPFTYKSSVYNGLRYKKLSWLVMLFVLKYVSYVEYILLKFSSEISIKSGFKKVKL